MNTLINYWKETFKDYKVMEDEHILRFYIKEFPDPIMSPIFLKKETSNTIHAPYLNLVTQNLQDHAHLSFDYGEIHFPIPKVINSDFNFEIVNLITVLENLDYWNLVQDAFPKDVGLLKRLLPFLGQLSSPHRVGLIYEDNKLVAAITLAYANEQAVVLNTMVHSSIRQRGTTQKLLSLLNLMVQGTPIKRACFWTQSPFLLKFAQAKGKYIIKKNQQGENV